MAFLAANARRLTAVAAVGLFYFMARPPATPAAARSTLASRFRFERVELPTAPGKTVMKVTDLPAHRDVEHMIAWVGAAGTSVALADLDGDGLANDACYVDTRTDTAMVLPVPGTGDRYAPILLEAEPVPNAQPLQFPTGCVAADYNEDGKQDLLVYYTTRSPVIFFRVGAGYVAKPLLPGSGAVWSSAAGLVADLDGDGHLDLMIGNYFQDGARMFDPKDEHSIEINDGLGMAMNGGTNEIFLWKSATQGDDPSVTFERVKGALPEDILRGWTLALGAVDIDGDHLPEIYIGNDFGPDRFLHNQSRPGHLSFRVLEGHRTFFKPKSKVMGHDSFKGMGVDVGDLNNDGLLDISVSNITSRFAFLESNFTYMNNGDLAGIKDGYAPFVDESEKMGLSRSGFSWDVRYGDFDNDGVLEILQATGFTKGEIDQYPELQELGIANDLLVKYPKAWMYMDGHHDLAGHETNPFWVRTDNGRYEDLAPELGISTPEVSRAIATADVDGDGDLDFIYGNLWETSYLYRNDCPSCGAYLGVHLRIAQEPGAATFTRAGHPGEDTPGRPAIGAIVRFTRPDGLKMMALVDASNGHSGKRSPDLHFGLGNTAADAKLKLQVRWRDPAGRIHDDEVELAPGWNTVQLGWSAGASS